MKPLRMDKDLEFWFQCAIPAPIMKVYYLNDRWQAKIETRVDGNHVGVSAKSAEEAIRRAYALAVAMKPWEVE